MKFKDLLELDYDRDTGKIDIETLKKTLPKTPICILNQVYSAHGRKSDFQEQYGELDINSLIWEKLSMPACRIISCTYYQGFKPWFENVKSRAEYFNGENWKCVDCRQEVVESWRINKTWLIPPIFLTNKTHNKLHLVEGHTRVGLLKGLVDQNILSTKTKHEVWIAKICTKEITKIQGLT